MILLQNNAVLLLIGSECNCTVIYYRHVLISFDCFFCLTQSTTGTLTIPICTWTRAPTTLTIALLPMLTLTKALTLLSTARVPMLATWRRWGRYPPTEKAASAVVAPDTPCYLIITIYTTILRSLRCKVAQKVLAP